MNYSDAARRSAGHACRLTACWIACVGATLVGTSAVAQEEDVVIFNNGDRLTGEIRGLSRAQLSFNTDATGTIQIDWVEVAELRSGQTFEIELANGVRYLGSLPAPEEPGELNVDVGGTQPLALSFTRVVTLTEIESTFGERLDVDLDFGYDFTRASEIERLTLAFNTVYRGDKNAGAVRLRTIRTDDGAIDRVTDQANINFEYSRLLPDRWLASGVLGFESNSELGIDLRTTVGGGAGRILSQSGQHRIAWLLGLARIREEVADSNEVTNSTEGVANLTIDWYRSDDKEFDISTRITIFPGISQSGRYRSSFDLDLEWELFGDATWGLTFYHNFDSDPPSATAIRADYGVITSVGVDF
jgi:hypothetical protein